MGENGKCLRKGCERDAHTRGLCKSHYVGLGKRVRAGKTTWTQLEAAGECRPSIQGVRSPRTRVLNVVAKKYHRAGRNLTVASPEIERICAEISQTMDLAQRTLAAYGAALAQLHKRSHALRLELIKSRAQCGKISQAARLAAENDGDGSHGENATGVPAPRADD